MSEVRKRIEWAKRHDWLAGLDVTCAERQARDEGRDLSDLKDDFQKLREVAENPRGLGVVPGKCRLRAEVEWTIRQYESGATWDEAVAALHQRWDERAFYDWCHAVSNAAVVVQSMLYGDDDYTRTVGLAVRGVRIPSGGNQRTGHRNGKHGSLDTGVNHRTPPGMTSTRIVRLRTCSSRSKSRAAGGRNGGETRI